MKTPTRRGMERASSRGMSCLCRGDADEDVHATEMSGESQGQFGKPQSSQGLRGTAGRGKPHVHKPGLLADMGWAPVPARLPFACVKRMVPDFAVVPRDRMRSSSHKLKIKFHFDMKNNFFTLRVEKGAPRGLWSPRVWGHLKPNWTPSCVT